MGGTILPAMPLPASTTIFSGLRPSVSIKLRQCFGVVFGDVGLFDGPWIFRGFRKVFLDDEVPDLTKPRVAGEGDGVFPAELEAVVVLGVVRGGQHGPAWLPEVPDGEVERVGRDEPEVEHVSPGLRDALYESLLAEPRPRGACRGRR